MRLASKCRVCTHKARDEIDTQLVQGRPVRKIAAQFGLSKDGVHRHKVNHVTPKLARVVRERIESGRMESLADQLADARDSVQVILDSAMSDGKGALALAAVAQLRATIESLDAMIQRERDREVKGGPIRTRVIYDEDGKPAGEEMEFDSLADLDVAIRKLEAEIEAGAGARGGLDLERLNDDERAQLQRLIQKMGVAAESVETGEEEPSGEDVDDAEVVEPETRTDARSAAPTTSRSSRRNGRADP